MADSYQDVCDICNGDKSALNCMCGGSGLMADALHNMRITILKGYESANKRMSLSNKIKNTLDEIGELNKQIQHRMDQINVRHGLIMGLLKEIDALDKDEG